MKGSEPSGYEVGTTTDRNNPGLRKIKPGGQQESYLVLSADERSKGFVRPVRRSYKHVGAPRSKHPLRDLTPEEHERYDRFLYVKYEEYPESKSSTAGRFWTQKQLDGACGGVTSMSQDLAETYARDPAFYGGTFCCVCGGHFPVGKDGEFTWLDAPDERVGT